jgi:DNA polymerase III alpha subunit (gram-positive type)
LWTHSWIPAQDIRGHKAVRSYSTAYECISQWGLCREVPLFSGVSMMSWKSERAYHCFSYVSAVKDAIAAMVAAIPEITIKDETNEFDDKEFKEEYKKIFRDAEECATIITKALNELPVLSYPKKIVLGKGLKIVRYQTFIKKHNQALNQSLKRKEKKHKEIKKKGAGCRG